MAKAGPQFLYSPPGSHNRALIYLPALFPLWPYCFNSIVHLFVTRTVSPTRIHFTVLASLLLEPNVQWQSRITSHYGKLTQPLLYPHTATFLILRGACSGKNLITWNICFSQGMKKTESPKEGPWKWEVPLACSLSTLWGGARRLGILACLSSTHKSHMAAARWFVLVLRASPRPEEGKGPLLRSFGDVNLLHTSSYHLWWSTPSG